MSISDQWFSIGTNESRVRGEPDRKIKVPSCDFTPEIFSDPFGVRRAIVPVFEREPNGKLQRVGAAFHVDGWGHFLTAHHVVDCYERSLPGGIRPGEMPVIDPLKGTHAVLLLATR
jgi:serine protease Do